MKRTTALVLILCMVLGLCACGGAEVPNRTDHVPEAELMVYAAASLTETMIKIKAMYEAEHNVSIILNFESSGTLKTQISMGADCDVFISAGQKQMDGLDASKQMNDSAKTDYVLEGSRIDLIENMVCLAVPKGNPAGITDFDNLAARLKTGDIMLAIGNSDVPVGQYSSKVLEYYGIDEKTLAAKGGILTYGSNAKEVTMQISAGSVDCGIIYSTDAAAAGLMVVDTASEEMCGRAVYPAAVMKTSKLIHEAQAFLDYLQGAAAAEVFRTAGFLPLN